MTDLREFTFAETDLDAVAGAEGRVAVFIDPCDFAKSSRFHRLRI